MKTEKFAIEVSESIGKVSAELIMPDSPIAVMALAHGAGADMNHRFMKALSLALAEGGIGTMRFNFPYMEKKKTRPDVPAVAEKTIEAAVEKLHSLFPQMPLLAGGKSFGGRMTSQRFSKQVHPSLRGLVFYGFPLHAAGQPSIARAEHLKLVSVPMLFLQGTRDSLADLTLIKQETEKLPAATLALFEGADHSFKAGKKEFILELAAGTISWFRTLSSKSS